MKPVLFNTQMVQAILVGRKTQTRRVVKPQFPEYLNREPGRFSKIVPHSPHSFLAEHEEHPNMKTVIQAPFISGDILYVRETWCNVNKPGVKPEYYYLADTVYCEDYDRSEWRWRPSIHMPKEAARIFLRVTNVRAERLQEISFEDNLAEGTPGRYLEVGHPDNPFSKAACIQHPFNELWDSTIKPENRAAFGWEANPWVWVIKFERCEKPEGLLDE